MRAFRINAVGDAPLLETVPRTEPAPGEVSVRILAAGLNFADLLMVEGTYQATPKVPFTLGLELAGIVEQLGDGVTDREIGQRVAVFSGQGGLADYGCFPAISCIPIPVEMTMEEAAGFQIAYGTGHLALVRRARLRPGERLVVLGAGGGVGLTAIELGVAMGASVVAVARGATKLAVAKKTGATHVIDSEDDDLKGRLKALGGADVVYDPVGGDQFNAAIRACNPEARYLVIGFASGDVPSIPANILLVKNVDVIGFYWGAYLGFHPQALAQSLTELFSLYRSGKIRPHIDICLPLARAQEGLDRLRERKSTGKIIITMDH